MKGFTKNPFGNKAREVLAEVSMDRGDGSTLRAPHDEYKGEDDLQLEDEGGYDDQYDQPAPPPPKKKKAKKKPAAAAAAQQQTELSAITTQDEPSSTSFQLPPPTSGSGVGSIAPGAKKYLNNVTSYFNEKRDQFNRSRDGGGSLSSADPEVSGTMDEIALREAALKRREAEILAKEQKVEAREREVKQYEGHLNNWPLKRWAILYHNIGEDILPENQRFIRFFYGLWLFTLFCLGWQFLAIVVDTFSGDCASGIVTILENIVFCCAGLFLSWLGWYKVIYDASKKSAISSLKYGRFTCGFTIHIGWVIVMLTGVWASDGIISLLETVTGSCKASSVFFGIGTAAWAINFLWSSYVSKLAYSKYKAAGGNFSTLRNDFTKEAAKAALSGA